jgi:hypothetical protein
LKRKVLLNQWAASLNPQYSQIDQGRSAIAVFIAPWLIHFWYQRLNTRISCIWKNRIGFLNSEGRQAKVPKESSVGRKEVIYP